MVGAVSENSAKVFVRTDETAQVSIDFSTDTNFSAPISTGAQTTTAAADFTRILQVDGLQSDTKYYYRVLVDGVSQHSTEFPSFITFPTAGDSGEFTFAVVADVTGPRYSDEPAPVYQRVSEESPAFVMQIGDFDHRNPRRLEVMRQMHRDVRGPATAAGADWAEYIAPNFPVYHVWDDHDYGRNNGDKTFPGRADALQAYQEYYPTPDLPNPGNGIWHSFSYGQAEFFMVDLRSQRDVDTDPDDANKSMLDGDNIPNGQKEWLKQGLLNSTAQWKFIVSSVPFNRTVGSLDQDPWIAFNTERQELLDYIASNSIDGVSIISADLHTGGGIDDGTNSDLPEITVPHTNLLRGDSGNSGSWSEGILTGNDGNSGYALITVDPAGGEVLFETKGHDGLTRHSYVFSLTPTTDPDIAVAPLSVDYGSVSVDETAQDVVTITNRGGQTLTISNLATTNSVYTVIGPATPLDIAPGGSTQVTIEFAPTVVGQEVGELQITSNDPDESLVSVALAGNGVVPGGNEFHINAGGGDYSTTTGVDFVADKAFVAGDFGYVDGDTRSVGAAIEGTEDDLLYQSLRNRRGDPFSYVFDAIANGDFEVTLYFSEPSPSALVGQRVFDVLAEGVVRLDDFDVMAAAGAPRTAHIETFVVTVGDGQLNLDFAPLDSDRAFVNAISVVELLPLAASSAATPFASSELIDAAVALAVAEEEVTLVEPNVAATLKPAEFIAVESVGRSRSASSSDDAAPTATDNRDNERQHRRRQRLWEDATDEVFAGEFGRWGLR